MNKICILERGQGVNFETPEKFIDRVNIFLLGKKIFKVSYHDAGWRVFVWYEDI